MITIQIVPTTPGILVDASTDDVTVILPIIAARRLTVIVSRTDSSGNTVTVKDISDATISTIPTTTLQQFNVVNGIWELTGQYPGGDSLPDQTGHAGEFLTTNGSVASWAAAGGTGTVTSVSVVSANGLAGTVATPTTTPAITLTTTITGLLKGNGTAISAAVADTDYATPAGVVAYAQPLDADLTAIAALTTASFGRGGLEQTSAGGFRTYIGAGTSSFDGAYSSLSGIPSTFAPSAHHTSHELGGTDAIKLDDLAAPDDNTDLNASTSAHGLMQKYPGGTTTFLRADGSFAAPPGGGGWTEVEVNLGSTPSWRGQFTITDAAISASSKVIVVQAPGPYTGKGTRADEADMIRLNCYAIPGSGSAAVRYETFGPTITTMSEIKGNQPVPSANTQSANPNYSVPVQKRLGVVSGNVKFYYQVA